MSDNIEIEVKIKITSQKKFDEIYLALGNPGWTLQRNYIFPFSGSILRLRYEDKTGKSFLTFKGQDVGREFNSREERECEIPAELFMGVASSINKIPVQKEGNFPSYYEKSRAQVSFMGCVICLDIFFGNYYCEIEGDEENIRKVIRHFGLDDFQIEKRSYLGLLMGMRDDKKNLN